MLHRVLHKCIGDLMTILSPRPIELDLEDFRSWWHDMLECATDTDCDFHIRTMFKKAYDDVPVNERIAIASLPEPFWVAIDVAFQKHVLMHMDAFGRLPHGNGRVSVIENTQWLRAMFEYALDVRRILLCAPPKGLNLHPATRAAIAAHGPLPPSIPMRAIVLIMGDPSDPDPIPPTPLVTMSFVEALTQRFKNVSVGVREVSEDCQTHVLCLADIHKIVARIEPFAVPIVETMTDVKGEHMTVTGVLYDRLDKSTKFRNTEVGRFEPSLSEEVSCVRCV